MIEQLGSKEEVRAAVAEARREGRRIGFVPTMGALHAGHRSLIQAARSRTDFVIVSVFVNPTQFAAGEDFERYPRDLESDRALLGADGVDIVFAPTTDAMYGSAGAEVTVNPGPLGERWEGEVRPGHFAGAATVVAKLFNIVRPDLAFFGEKDYQQLLVVRRMVRDLDLGVGVIACPTVREPDGLALSSRNAFLTAEDRIAARAFPEALEAAARTIAWGETDARALEAAMRDVVAEIAGDAVSLDYATVVNAETLEPLERVGSVARALIAGRIGATRLIDNAPLVLPVAEGGAA